METLYTIGGAVIFTIMVAAVFYACVGIVLLIGRIAGIENLPSDPYEKQQRQAAQTKRTRYPKVYGEPVKNIPVYDSEIVEDYQPLNSRNPQTKRLLTEKKEAGWFERPFEPKTVGDFCVCNHCGHANNWIAGFVNICTSCGKKL